MKSPVLIALLAASPVFAECPVAADLDQGVRVTEDSGTTNTFVTLSDGLVQQDGATLDGYTFRNVLALGTHLVRLGDTENGTMIADTDIRTDYGVDLPVPQPSTSNTFETTVTTANGSYPETQTQSWGAMTTLTIGDCTYDMIPGKLTYTNSSYTVFEGLHYLPALELALLHSYQIEGETTDRYVAAEIEKLP